MMLPSDGYEATLEFRCSAGHEEAIRQAVADLLAEQLDHHGFNLMGIDDRRDEDTSWVELANIRPFVVQVAIRKHPHVRGLMLASIYPPLPYVRVCLRKVSTVAVVKELGEAARSILENLSICGDVRWLSEGEIRRLWL